MEVMTSMTSHNLKVDKMNNLSSKNDTYNPIFTELLIFHPGGNDLKVDKMNNLSWKLNLAHPKCIKMTPITLYLPSC